MTGDGNDSLPTQDSSSRLEDWECHRDSRMTFFYGGLAMTWGGKGLWIPACAGMTGRSEIAAALRAFVMTYFLWVTDSSSRLGSRGMASGCQDDRLTEDAGRREIATGTSCLRIYERVTYVNSSKTL